MVYTFPKLQQFKRIQATHDPEIILKTIIKLFSFDRDQNPLETNGYILYQAWKTLKQFPQHINDELMYKRFYKGSRERYKIFIEPHMKRIAPQPFEMGFHPGETFKYCGEEPLHTVTLSPYFINDIPITQNLYKLYNPTYTLMDDPVMPVVDVSWYDAVMFTLWVGCRLPSEAEWEYACRAGSTGSWCCDTEEELVKYGWFSENSKGQLHPVAKLKPNAYGLYDMHGNVWEWCQDSYEDNYYKRSKKRNPVNNKRGTNKVCRGGSIHAFGTMCRSGLRYNEAPYYYAKDIGFRLAKDVITK